MAIGGDAKVQLGSKWSTSPAPTANLLSIASRKGLVAAAGPDALFIATTESVRQAFDTTKTGDSEVRPFEPQAKMPLPMRISQLAFTADEQYLILSAEQGGGLAVYETQSLIQGSSQSAFELATSGESLRALIPNPMPEMADLCAVVTDNGNLLMANLKDRSLVNGTDGPVLKSQVTCAAWSTKGKQLVAGMGDGTIVQMTPDGTQKAQIPKPSSLGDYHVSSISWLENHVFLVIHSETHDSTKSAYHIITRQQPPGGKAPTFEFRKLTDPVEPFGADKPPHHAVLRLKDYPPNLQDLLIVSSTANIDLGLLTRAKIPLDGSKSAEAITNVFTTTEFSDDSQRAQLPMGSDYSETYPIGVSLDLSAKDKVYRPVKADEEIEYSPGPLPGLWALNNEGVLSSWWVIYNEGIRDGVTYPGMVASEDAPAPQSAAPVSTIPSAFAAPSAPATAFGGSSALGVKSSPWGAATSPSPAPAFASPAAPNPFAGAAAASGAAPAFGTPSGLSLGAKVSPWAAASTGAAGPSFGSPGLSNNGTTGKVFGGGGAAATNPAPGAGFAGFANKTGFANLAGNTSGGSIFSAKPTQSSAFTSTNKNTNQSVFGGKTTSSVFGAPAERPAAAPLGSSPLGPSPFVLGSTFKADPATANDNEKPGEKSGGSLFGGGFDLSLGDTPESPAPDEGAKDEDMDAATPKTEKPKSIFDVAQGSATPAATPAPSSLFASTATTPNPFSTTTPPANTPFGTSSATPKANPFESKPKEALEAPLPPESTSKASYPFGGSSSSSIASAYTPEDTKTAPTSAPDDAPLPPDFVTQPSKVSEEAPLPPDFTKMPRADTEPVPPPLPKDESPAPEEPLDPHTPDDAPLPPDFLEEPTSEQPSPLPEVPSSPEEGDLSSEGAVEDEDADGEGEEASEDGTEGSGVDVAKDLSPNSTGPGQTSGITPQSSFGGMGGSTFSSMPRPDVAQPRASLFGELHRNAPMFPQPSPLSPRSPSPVRGPIPSRMLRPEVSRSVSAPGMASEILGTSRQGKGSGSGKTNIISRPVAPQEDPNVKLQREARERTAREESQPLAEDQEYEMIQEHLESEVEPSRDIAEFTAFSSVTADAQASTVAAQVEALYRDMNCMLQTLGLNARALSSFMKYHTEEGKGGGRTKDDLANADDWVLCEAEDLNRIIDDDLTADLERGRVHDFEDEWDTCQDLLREMPKLRAKQEDLKRILDGMFDPDHAAATRSLPLSADHAAQQGELRQAQIRLSSLLAEAESGLTMLKTKLASAAGSAGKAAAVPTVDAIMKTIMKMTSMAEKRSGDVDMLENQMRKLRFTSVVESREGSPYMTPPPRNSFRSPDPRRSLGASSVGSFGRSGTPQRKKISGFTVEDKQAIRAKMEKRQTVLGRLKATIRKNGPKVSRLDGSEDVT